jgi:hypothetical protein
MAAALGNSYPAATVGGSCDDGIGQSLSSLNQNPWMQQISSPLQMIPQ